MTVQFLVLGEKNNEEWRDLHINPNYIDSWFYADEVDDDLDGVAINVSVMGNRFTLKSEPKLMDILLDIKNM